VVRIKPILGIGNGGSGSFIFPGIYTTDNLPEGLINQYLNGHNTDDLLEGIINFYITQDEKDKLSGLTKIHNNLDNLQGGDSISDEYYHLTQDERDKILGIVIPDILDQKTFTGDDNIVFLDFTRKSIRLDSAIDSVLTLPIMTEDYDGSKLRLILVGTGTGTLLCQGDDTIWNELDTQLIGTTQYGSVDIEYVWTEKMFICRTQGSWESE